MLADGTVDMVKLNDLLTTTNYGDLKTIMSSGLGLAAIADSTFARENGEYIEDEAGKRVLVNDETLLKAAGKQFYDTLLKASGSYSAVSSASKLDKSSYVTLYKAMYEAGGTLDEDAEK